MTDKDISSQTLMLHDSDSIISENNFVADIFNAIFSTIFADIDKPDIINNADTMLCFIECHSEHLIDMMKRKLICQRLFPGNLKTQSIIKNISWISKTYVWSV